MTTQNVNALIESFSLPYAYHQFADGTGQEPPFICFFYGDRSDLIADNVNYSKFVRLYIELYTDEKDFDIESTIESKLNENDIVYAMSEDYIDSERMHITVYETTINLEDSNEQ